MTREDIALANRIAHDVLGRTLDELPPQTRRLLTLLVDWVKQECEARDETREALRFTRREVRTATRWGGSAPGSKGQKPLLGKKSPSQHLA